MYSHETNGNNCHSYVFQYIYVCNINYKHTGLHKFRENVWVSQKNNTLNSTRINFTYFIVGKVVHETAPQWIISKYHGDILYMVRT